MPSFFKSGCISTENQTRDNTQCNNLRFNSIRKPIPVTTLKKQQSIQRSGSPKKTA